MRFESPLVKATFVRRYKRFFAEATLEDGRVVTAWCANPGAMTSSAAPGWPVWLSATDPADLAEGRRKLAWTLELVEAGPDRVPILVHTGRPNAVVAEGIAAGAVPALAGYDRLRSEVRYGKKSRVDLLLESDGRPPCYVEVKNVTLLLSPGVAAFPDAVTTRGARHLEELAAVVAGGARAVLFYLVRSDAAEVRPARAIDPAYAAALADAAAAGVEVLAAKVVASPEGLWLGEAVPAVEIRP